MCDVLKVFIDRAIACIERPMDKHAATHGRTGLRKSHRPDRHHGCANGSTRGNTVQDRTGTTGYRACFQLASPSIYIHSVTTCSGQPWPLSRLAHKTELTLGHGSSGEKYNAQQGKYDTSLVGVVDEKVSCRITGVTRYNQMMNCATSLAASDIEERVGDEGSLGAC
jgi:hypothetical protein